MATHDKTIIESLASKILLIEDKEIKLDVQKDDFFRNRNNYNFHLLKDIFE